MTDGWQPNFEVKVQIQIPCSLSSASTCSPYLREVCIQSCHLSAERIFIHYTVDAAVMVAACVCLNVVANRHKH